MVPSERGTGEQHSHQWVKSHGEDCRSVPAQHPVCLPVSASQSLIVLSQHAAATVLSSGKRPPPRRGAPCPCKVSFSLPVPMSISWPSGPGAGDECLAVAEKRHR